MILPSIRGLKFLRDRLIPLLPSDLRGVGRIGLAAAVLTIGCSGETATTPYEVLGVQFETVGTAAAQVCIDYIASDGRARTCKLLLDEEGQRGTDHPCVLAVKVGETLPDPCR